MAAGREHGLVNAGYRAIETLRLEKGYRAWGSDIGPDHTPVEAGLAWTVKLKQNIDFKGRAAIEAQVSGGVKKMRSEEHTSELQSLMRISYAVFCLKKKNTPQH